MNDNNTIKFVEVPNQFRFIIERALYELNIRTSNLAFMLDKNLDNPQFLESDLCKELEERVVDANINLWSVISGVRYSLNLPEQYTLHRKETNNGYYLTY